MKKNTNVLVMALSLGMNLSFGIATSEASIITLDAINDTYISNNNPDTNYGSSDSIYLGRGNYWGLGSWRGLFEFDLSSVSSPIRSATFYWYANSGGEAAGGLVNELHRVTSGWAEDTTTWLSQPTFDSEVISTTLIGDSFSRPGWRTWDVTSLAKQWKKGSFTNYGFLIKPQNESSAGASRYDIGYSSEFSGIAFQPYLEIETAGHHANIQVVPLPASFLLLISGCVFLAGMGNRNKTT